VNEREQLEQAIAALEAQRILLGDSAVDTALGLLREKLASLRAAAPAVSGDAQRKLVTVLFADVAGFTALAETLDAEELSDAINALWRRLDAVIAAHGGTIDKHIGDAVMALFGAPVAREDDPERAVRAGLAMQEAIAGPQFAIRIGIHSGPVILGPLGASTQSTAIGDTVNVANRLEQGAPVGSVLVSQDTYRQVRGLFECQSLGALTLPGRAEPLPVYRVLRAYPRSLRVSLRGVEGVETHMIGNEHELARLQAFLHAAIHDRRTHVITIVGEAGIGKSRLLAEFDAWIDVSRLPHGQVFYGRATPESVKQPYALLRDLLTFLAEIREHDQPAVMCEKLERSLTQYFGDDVPGLLRAHALGYLAGFDFSASPHLRGLLSDPQAFNEQAHAYLGDFFAAAARQGPCLVFLEDIHWSDDRTLDAFAAAVNAHPDLPWLVVCLARPALFERRPAWGTAATRGAVWEVVELHPLPDEDGARLVDEILRRVEEVPPTLRELIVNAAEGNPFFIEELIKVLIEDGALLKPPPGASGPWRVDLSRMAGIRVPATLTGVLQARLDALPPAERLVLQRAAVVGHVFWDVAVAGLSEHATGPVDPSPGALGEIEDALTALRSKDMLYWLGQSAFPRVYEYSFKNALLREVAYESVLKRTRRTYHLQVAVWLANVARENERLDEYAAQIAEHYERAGEPGEAVTYLEQAGAHALQASAFSEAVTFFERAIALAAPANGASSARLAVLRRQLGTACLRLSDYGPARQHFEQSLTLARAMGDVPGVAAALRQLGQLSLITGAHGKARLLLEESLDLFRALNDRAGIQAALDSLGSVAWRQGNHREAIAHYTESLGVARALGDPSLLASPLNNLGNVYLRQGDYAEARRCYEESLAAARARGDRWGVARVLSNLGEVEEQHGDFEQAQAYYDESLALAREIGDRGLLVDLYANFGVLAGLQRRFDVAQSRFEESLALARALGNRMGVLFALGGLGKVAHEQQDHERARMRYEEAMGMARELGHRAQIAWLTGNLGRLAYDTGDAASAARLAREALALNRAIGAHPGAAENVLLLARLAAAGGDLDEAVALAARALHDAAASRVTGEQAQDLLVQLEAQLEPEEFAAAFTAGQGRDLDELT
jgi:class 3 adenylate cyclase/tetratricopeptide (TPR) repeat protein